MAIQRVQQLTQKISNPIEYIEHNFTNPTPKLNDTTPINTSANTNAPLNSIANIAECNVEASYQYPIMINTLGHYSLSVNNKHKNSHNKGHRKPNELLKVLIAFGGRSVGEVRISDAIWPDADGDVAHTSFSVTLHRLRKLLGGDALLLNDSHLTLNSQQCWVDVWELEKTLNELKDNINKQGNDHRSITQLANQALQLYQGPFLGNEDEQPWYIAYRDKINNKFSNCLMLICDYFEHINRCDLAMQFYRKGIEINPLQEELYIRLMKCYAVKNRYAEAIAMYQQCTRLLDALLGIAPSPDSTNLYHNILRQAQ
ncbi:MAG: hypothetical protein GXP08_03280 [Gammaproteobacteria bacterium]|nr:hypothetical protein [Gammaproteobacteria bacterium]